MMQKDQISECRAHAARKGWEIVEQRVESDSALTGGVVGRDGLERLKEAAKQKPQPFDCILIDNISHLARDLTDALREVESFSSYGILIIFVDAGRAKGDAR
jgi:DNA invertase Pin-like site-specific DNA recombinase